MGPSSHRSTLILFHKFTLVYVKEKQAFHIFQAIIFHAQIGLLFQSTHCLCLPLSPFTS